MSRVRIESRNTCWISRNEPVVCCSNKPWNTYELVVLKRKGLLGLYLATLRISRTESDGMEVRSSTYSLLLFLEESVVLKNSESPPSTNQNYAW